MTDLSAGGLRSRDDFEEAPESSVVVFAVWEPILPTDWGAPGTSVLDRLNDRRVRQFWDPGHVLAAGSKKAEVSSNIHPDCCDRKGFLWDLTAAYAPAPQLERRAAGAGSPERPGGANHA